MTPEPVYILGAGMHPWGGKWGGHDFTEYGVVAARAALAEAGLDWRQIQMVAGADTIRNGYPRLHRRLDVRAEVGLERGCPSPPATPPAPVAPKPCRAPARTSWPDSAMSPS